MPAKKLLFRDEARDKIRRGVDTLAEAVKVTLGPRGRTVVLGAGTAFFDPGTPLRLKPLGRENLPQDVVLLRYGRAE